MKKICIIPNCKRPFESYDRVTYRRHGDLKRPMNAMTCNPFCSRKWTGMKDKKEKAKLKKNWMKKYGRQKRGKR